jgi:hypothetical protein
MRLQQGVDSSFEQESIVDGNVADIIDSVPARLTSTSDRSIHHVI